MFLLKKMSYMVEYKCIQLLYRKLYMRFGYYYVAEVKMDNILRIETKKYTEESIVISSRIPKDMLQDIDFVAKNTGRTRNEIIQLFLDFALKHTEIVEKQD